MRKIIFVTGAASGIGKYICKRLDYERYKIIGLDRKGNNKKYINVDVSNYADISDKLSRYKNKKTYGIINCAGILIEKPYNKFSGEDWEEIIGCNVQSIWNLCKYFHDELIESNGCIINISSVHSVTTLPNRSIYAMTKGAVESLTRGLAIELGGHGVRVNCIRPGPILTKMLNIEDLDINEIPIKRVGKAKDIMEVVNLLLHNNFITGETITVDGGITSQLSIST